ncbi:MAG: hypothetical protein Ct9H300mP25_01600 [Acidobacteriota bacterium]|nr:MAG: hypothetical protein Ct9H300mP25_01600 [Acidobacteriota bacterium]
MGDLTDTDRRLKFLKTDAHALEKNIPATANLFISQSAIEHFDDDLMFFSTLKHFIIERNASYKIHFSHLPHAYPLFVAGVRQYTPEQSQKSLNFWGKKDLFNAGCTDLGKTL